MSPSHRALIDEIYTAFTNINSKRKNGFGSPHGRECEGCGGKAEHIRQIPTTMSTEGPQPSTGAMIITVCGSGECDGRVTQDVLKTMQRFRSFGQPHWEHAEEIARMFRCEKCRTWGGVGKCLRYQYIGCCGKECQKGDWKTHKVGWRKGTTSAWGCLVLLGASPLQGPRLSWLVFINSG